MVGYAWSSNQIMSIDTDDPPIKPDLSFNNSVVILSLKKIWMSLYSTEKKYVKLKEQIHIEIKIIMFCSIYCHQQKNFSMLKINYLILISAKSFYIKIISIVEFIVDFINILRSLTLSYWNLNYQLLRYLISLKSLK